MCPPRVRYREGEINLSRLLESSRGPFKVLTSSLKVRWGGEDGLSGTTDRGRKSGVAHSETPKLKGPSTPTCAGDVGWELCKKIRLRSGGGGRPVTSRDQSGLRG